MRFIVSENEKKCDIVLEESAFSGVKKIAGKVAGDIRLVTENGAVVRNLGENTDPEQISGNIFVGTVGCSELLNKLESMGRISLSDVRGKREVYGFRIIEDPGQESTLVIAGSDKRGTIYGLFHVSELLGVSPWVWFSDVTPMKLESAVFTEEVNFVSKEPSVKYRGFFINDEWPSFGNWTFEHFGGFTAEMYDHVFELLLRLKGNYLWPAMWTSNFSLDGPGLENARLADEYGVVMSNSHHEPCLRHSEEWDLVKGPDSEYGDKWNFDQNKEGLRRYWRDGLKRNGAFENIITMGMRGERDSEILGHSATLKENIDYLKEVITTQNRLIRDYVDQDLSRVPRMLAVYKEVEQYFYGDKDTEGLRYWPELDGITCMLCDDNYGNMRILPEAHEADRKGGWGMYYHFDYHGGPVSYEWVNSTYLPKVWEQMGQAYESGVREIWIVNVGDLKPQELPLSYFLDLAYDFDKWGTNDPDSASKYLAMWTQDQFGSYFDDDDISDIYELLEGYTRLNSIRKPEALWPDTYHPVHYGEADSVLMRAGTYEEMAERLLEKAKYLPIYDAFYQLVYYPVCASMNLLKMQIFAGRNALFAAQGRPLANGYGEEIPVCMDKDLKLRDEYHRIAGGKWNGIMLSEHIGFTHWNDEEAEYPVRSVVIPSRKSRLVASLKDRVTYTCGGDWTGRPLYSLGFLKPDTSVQEIHLENAGTGDVSFEIISDDEWIVPSGFYGSGNGQAKLAEGDVCNIELRIDRAALKRAASAEKDHVIKGCVRIVSSCAKIKTFVIAKAFEEKELEHNHYVPVLPGRFIGEVYPEYRMGYLPSSRRIMEEGDDIGLALSAADHDTICSGDGGDYVIMAPYGKYDAGAKAFPVTKTYTPGKDAPSLTYRVFLPEEGTYLITFLTAPTNPVTPDGNHRIGFKWRDEQIREIQLLGEKYVGGDSGCDEWSKGVLNQIHRKNTLVQGVKGENEFIIYAQDPGVILERVLIRKGGSDWAKGYFGPLPEFLEM